MIRTEDNLQFFIRRIRETGQHWRYSTLLSKIFMMKDALGRPFPYVPTDFQKIWHEHFWLINRFGKHRLWTKGRGLGATACTMMDLIMMARCYHDLKIPITSVTSTQVQMGPIEWGAWLCDTARIPNLNRDETVSREIRIKETGSIIFKIPGGNPDALRTYRCPVVFYDEFDWCEKNKDLLAVGNRTMSEGGQASVISTIQKQTGEFQRLIDNKDLLNYWVLETPIFDPKRFDIGRPIPEQIKEGITPIAPWLDIMALENERIRDPPIFMRENQCRAPDYGSVYLTWALINKCAILEFENIGYAERYSKRFRDNDNVIQLGFDFARSKDLSVCTLFELSDKWRQIFERTMRGSDTPTQNGVIDNVVDRYRPDYMRVDMTGNGTGLYDYARKKHGHRIQGVHFAEKRMVNWQKGTRLKDTLKNLMAVHLRTTMQDDEVEFFDYLELKEDLHSVPIDLQNPRRTDEGSHGDRFWANALAIYPAHIRKTPFNISFGVRPR